MSIPTSADPFPDDPIRPSRAATIAGVRVRAIYRRIERGQLRAWRDEDTGQLRVSEADVRAKWRRVEGGTRSGAARTHAVSGTVRERQKREALAEARRMARLPPLPDA